MLTRHWWFSIIWVYFLYKYLYNHGNLLLDPFFNGEYWIQVLRYCHSMIHWRLSLLYNSTLWVSLWWNIAISCYRLGKFSTNSTDLGFDTRPTLSLSGWLLAQLFQDELSTMHWIRLLSTALPFWWEDLLLDGCPCCQHLDKGRPSSLPSLWYLVVWVAVSVTAVGVKFCFWAYYDRWTMAAISVSWSRRVVSSTDCTSLISLPGLVE